MIEYGEYKIIACCSSNPDCLPFGNEESFSFKLSLNVETESVCHFYEFCLSGVVRLCLCSLFLTALVSMLTMILVISLGISCSFPFACILFCYHLHLAIFLPSAFLSVCFLFSPLLLILVCVRACVRARACVSSPQCTTSYKAPQPQNPNHCYGILQ